LWQHALPGSRIPETQITREGGDSPRAASLPENIESLRRRDDSDPVRVAQSQRGDPPERPSSSLPLSSITTTTTILPPNTAAPEDEPLPFLKGLALRDVADAFLEGSFTIDKAFKETFRTRLSTNGLHHIVRYHRLDFVVKPVGRIFAPTPPAFLVKDKDFFFGDIILRNPAWYFGTNLFLVCRDCVVVVGTVNTVVPKIVRHMVFECPSLEERSLVRFGHIVICNSSTYNA